MNVKEYAKNYNLELTEEKIQKIEQAKWDIFMRNSLKILDYKVRHNQK